MKKNKGPMRKIVEWSAYIGGGLFGWQEVKLECGHFAYLSPNQKKTHCRKCGEYLF